MSTVPPLPQAAQDPSHVEGILARLAAEGQRSRAEEGLLQRKVALERVGQGSMPSVRPPKIRYTHEAMADLILENPWISQNQLAAHFGYSPSWISIVITSDAFQALLQARRAELVDPELRVTLQERFQALTVQSLRVLQEKLAKPADQVSDQLALRAAELGAKSLGIGGHAPPQQVTSEERLAALAHRLIALRGGSQAPQEISDAHIIEAPLAAQG